MTDEKYVNEWMSEGVYDDLDKLTSTQLTENLASHLRKVVYQTTWEASSYHFAMAQIQILQKRLEKLEKEK